MLCSEVDIGLVAQVILGLRISVFLHALGLFFHLVEALDIFIVVDALLGAQVLADGVDARGLDELILATAAVSPVTLARHDVVALEA